MQVCPKCGYDNNTLDWYKSKGIYYAKSKDPDIKYKIEIEKNVTWFYWEGAKQRKRKLPVCYIVYIFEGEKWDSYKGCITLEEAKQCCELYEN